MKKYQQAVEDMILHHKEVFDTFTEVHKKYDSDPVSWQKEFNEKGQEVLRIIQRYDTLLCQKSESSRYGKFSANLSEKFWQEVRKIYPKIDYVGMQ